MSSNNNTETAQQRREQLLAAQAERQRLRDEEIARQEAEFAAEMERLEEEAAREEEERQIAKEHWNQLEVIVPLRASGSKTKAFKSKLIISDESDVVEVVEEQAEPPREVKRKRTIKMIAKNNFPNPTGDFDSREGEDDDDEDDKPPLPLPTSTGMHAHASYATCSGNGVVGLGIMPLGDRGAGQNIKLTQLLCRSLEVQEKMLGIMVRAEKRVIEAMGESEKDEGEDEDEDGKGEEDEEEAEENNEEKRRNEICEGKKCAE
ncbi:hypothetical protein GGU11DRAFT_749399 [Lentinula aff. detonsa]|nr:hypothetical protein GGU11DRAFT_749399 [Lentinula aff. detonsa]